MKVGGQVCVLQVDANDGDAGPLLSRDIENNLK